MEAGHRAVLPVSQQLKGNRQMSCKQERQSQNTTINCLSFENRIGTSENANGKGQKERTWGLIGSTDHNKLGGPLGFQSGVSSTFPPIASTSVSFPVSKKRVNDKRKFLGLSE